MSVQTKRRKTKKSILLGAMLATLALSSCGSKSDGAQGQANAGVSGEEETTATKAATISSDDVMKLCPSQLKEMFKSDIETVKEMSPETFSECEGKSLEVSYGGEKAAYLNDAYVTLVSYSLSCGEKEVFMGTRGLNKECEEAAYGKVKNAEGEEDIIKTDISPIEGSFTIDYSTVVEQEQEVDAESEEGEQVANAETPDTQGDEVAQEEQTEEAVAEAEVVEQAEEEIAETEEGELPEAQSSDLAETSVSGACKEQIEKEVKSLLDAEAIGENCAYNKVETKVSYARVTAGLENVSVINFKASCEGSFKTQVGYIGMDSECNVSKVTEAGIEKEKFNAQKVTIE